MTTMLQGAMIVAMALAACEMRDGIVSRVWWSVVLGAAAMILAVIGLLALEQLMEGPW